MKKIFYFLAISLLLIGCEGNNPKLKNQPLNKKGEINKYWTPAGHIYFHEYSDGDGYEVYRFYEKKDECVCDKYFTRNNDMSEQEGDVNRYGLAGEYPNFTIVHARTGREYKCTFTDTLTCTIDGQSCKLYR